jgi:hypothetical protein
VDLRCYIEGTHAVGAALNLQPMSGLILGSGLLDERLLRSMLSMECMIKHMS